MQKICTICTNEICNIYVYMLLYTKICKSQICIYMQISICMYMQKNMQKYAKLNMHKYAFLKYA